jgi:hypothetical protein
VLPVQKTALYRALASKALRLSMGLVVVAAYILCLLE